MNFSRSQGSRSRKSLETDSSTPGPYWSSRLELSKLETHFWSEIFQWSKDTAFGSKRNLIFSENFQRTSIRREKHLLKVSYPKPKNNKNNNEKWVAVELEETALSSNFVVYSNFILALLISKASEIGFANDLERRLKVSSWNFGVRIAFF